MAMVSDKFADQLFLLDSNPWQEPLWIGYSHESSKHTFRSAVEDAIRDGLLTEPGHYCIVRLDRTTKSDAMPYIPFVGTVKEDMTVIEGLQALTIESVANIVHWPPRKARS